MHGVFSRATTAGSERVVATQRVANTRGKFEQVDAEKAAWRAKKKAARPESEHLAGMPLESVDVHHKTSRWLHSRQAAMDAIEKEPGVST